MRAAGPSGWGKEADVNPLRRCRAGFTLTEILMATGILGIGLTMVASVFPVAVDQSRRSQDITMAALSARSVAAAMRANRDTILPWLRKKGRGGYVKQTNDSDRANWPPWEITRNQWAKIPGTMRGYNPNFFLYYSGEVSPGALTPSPGDSGILPPRHDATRTYVNFQRGTDGTGSISKGLDSVGVVWMAGGYVPVVFATPLDGFYSSTNKNPIIGGPWLLTIVIYKSQGMPPPSVDYMACTQMKPDNKSTNPDRYMKAWVCKEGAGWPFRGAPGMYVMNWPGDTTSPQTVPTYDRTLTVVDLSLYHGEAYLIESVTPDPSGAPASDKITFAATGTVNMPATYNKYPNALTAASIPNCITLPGAIAVYHTVLGD
jgi:prepilin-type N-terminal cleavage/methylation domain-containing protein